HGHRLHPRALRKEPDDDHAVAVSAHSDTPDKIDDLYVSGQQRLNGKLRSGPVTAPAETDAELAGVLADDLDVLRFLQMLTGRDLMTTLADGEGCRDRRQASLRSAD
ncbi:MAG TPA: hypothetical protein VIJ82_11300, partial [Streptosporangiaceae bacterium]